MKTEQDRDGPVVTTAMIAWGGSLPLPLFQYTTAVIGFSIARTRCFDYRIFRYCEPVILRIDTWIDRDDYFTVNSDIAEL